MFPDVWRRWRNGNIDMGGMHQDRWTTVALIGVVLLSLSATLPSAHQRGYYGDDYPIRSAALDGVWTGCQQYWQRVGYIRPLGYFNLMTWLAKGWDHPTLMHLLVAAGHVAACLLLYVLTLRITASRIAGLIAAAFFACWHTSTMVTSWLTSGAMILPAGICLILAFIAWHRAITQAARRSFLIAVIAFAASIAFYDQAILMPATFSATALLWSRHGQRARAALQSLIFWCISGTVGVVSIMTSAQTDRPLTLEWHTLTRSLAAVGNQFIDMTIRQPIQSAMNGAPPLGWLTDMWRDDRAVLIAAIALFTIGLIFWLCGARCVQAQPAEDGTPSRTDLRAIAAGIFIFLCATAIFTLTPEATHLGRHTFVPSIGLCIALGAFLSKFPKPTHAMARLALIAALITPLAVTRITATYTWTLQTRTLDAILTALDQQLPNSQQEELVVIDGVRGMGRGFADSWGMTYALRLRGHKATEVSTYLRQQEGLIYANAEWDRTWPIDPQRTRVYHWDRTAQTLRASSLTEYQANHPERFAPIAVAEMPARPDAKQ